MGLAVNPPPVAEDPAGVGRHGVFEDVAPPPKVRPQRFVFAGRVARDQAEGIFAFGRTE